MENNKCCNCLTLNTTSTDLLQQSFQQNDILASHCSSILIEVIVILLN